MDTMIDTLRIYERLKGADLTDRAAREIAEVFRETIEDRLVTKKDLKESLEIVKAELETVIAKTRVEIIKWVAGMLIAQAAIIATLVKLL
jgi:hypothetical protein